MHSESHSITIDIEPYKLRIFKHQTIDPRPNEIEIYVLIKSNIAYYTYAGVIYFKQEQEQERYYFNTKSPHYANQKIIESLINNNIIEIQRDTLCLQNHILLQLI